jgi:hypothetical protein
LCHCVVNPWGLYSARLVNVSASHLKKLDDTDLEGNNQLLSGLYEILDCRYVYELGERLHH